MLFSDYDLVICVLILVVLYLFMKSEPQRDSFLNGPEQGGADAMIGIVPKIYRRIISQ